MAVAGRSVLENSSTVLNLNIIASGFTNADRNMLRRSWKHEACGTIQFAEINADKLDGFRSTAYLESKLFYAPYFWADLFRDLDRCIYIDTDVIVEKELAVVAVMDLQGHGLAAALDPRTLIAPENPELCLRLGLRNEWNYFNAGVLVVEQSYWIRNEISEYLIDLSIQKYHELHSQDPDALNIVSKDWVLILDSDWNTSQYWQSNPIDDKIIHLLDTDKPWHALYRKKFIEAYYEDAIWATVYNYLEKTVYSGRLLATSMGLAPVLETLRKKVPTLDMLWSAAVAKN
jgi:lipopolysaccharide biosynthesis glycosyltransferase